MSEQVKERPRSYAHAPRLPEGERLDVREIVPGEGPLLVEIGSGRGKFAMQVLAQKPLGRLLAFEVRLKYATILSERFAAAGYANARCFADDARAALARLVPDGSVDAVAIHFPDPWWKKRHAKRLVVADALVAQLARLVRSGGIVFVQTDVVERADQYAAALVAGGFFARERVEPDVAPYAGESPFAPARSNREARAIADGLPIYRIVLRRV